jgi:FkbM family methyltransferase
MISPPGQLGRSGPAVFASSSRRAFVPTMKKQSLLFRLLLFYGSRVPYHRGKGWLIERWLRFFNLHVDEEFDIVREGLRWRLNPADFVHADVFWLGRKDYYDVYHLQRMLKPGDVCFDVGANFGYYSVALASRLNKKCVIHAFEPNPPTLARLRHHVAINGLDDVVHVHDIALSDQEGTAALATKAGNSGGTHIVASDATSILVRLSTLDAFCDEQRLTRLDAVKIDVEGFEERVLLGGQRTLKRWRPVLLLELEPARLRDKQTSVERVVLLLQELGYALFVSRRRTLEPLRHLPEGDDAQMNVFCLPQPGVV